MSSLLIQEVILGIVILLNMILNMIVMNTNLKQDNPIHVSAPNPIWYIMFGGVVAMIFNLCN